MVLFVPIRYSINAEQQGKFQCQIRVNWLLRCISCFGEYTEERFIYRLKILGITVKSNLSEKVKKKSGNKKHIKKARKNKENSDKNTRKNALDEKTKKERISKENKVDKIEESERTNQIKSEKTIVAENVKNTHNNVKENVIERAIDKEQDETEIKLTFFEKIKVIFSEKYREFLKKIQGIKKKIKNMIISIKSSISKIKLIWTFLTEEENKAGFKTCMEAVKKTVRHMKPKVLKGYLKFGTEDPCKTGQILGIIAMFYGKYGRFFEIVPDFEKAVLEYTIYAKGRIRIFTVGKIALQLWFNKKFKKLIENYEHCKEELENGR